jgi:hypothetical protein
MTARVRREIALLLLGMQAAVLGQSPAPTRYAPNGHTLDAADFLSELGERSLRCSACELVAERMDYMIPLLVRTWPTRSSAERAKMLRAMLVQRGCKQIDAMHVALMGDHGCAATLLQSPCAGLAPHESTHVAAQVP